MRESFVFYESFLKALDELDPETERIVYRAITHYALREEEPQLSGVAWAIFSLIKPQIDANNKKFEAGKKGGRPRTGKNKNQEQENGSGEDVKDTAEPGENFLAFGEYGNVYLTQMQRNKLDTLTLDKKYSEDLIDELSRKIASDKSGTLVFSEKNPDMHIAKLEAFFYQKRKNGQTKNTAGSGKLNWSI